METTDTKIISAEEVATFLNLHPDFFVGRDDLLLPLTLPHQRGDTISLVERQVALLRDRVLGYRQHLDRLSDNARDNEKTFERMRKLVLSLIESRDLEQVVEVITDSLAHDFLVESHSLILFSDKPISLPVRVEPIDIAVAALGDRVARGDVIIGLVSDEQVSDKQMAFLFPEHSDGVASVAIIPLHYPLHTPAGMGVLALASKDPEHFQAGTGSVFVRYLGEVLSRVLAQRVP